MIDQLLFNAKLQGAQSYSQWVVILIFRFKKTFCAMSKFIYTLVLNFEQVLSGRLQNSEQL